MHEVVLWWLQVGEGRGFSLCNFKLWSFLVSNVFEVDMIIVSKAKFIRGY